MGEEYDDVVAERDALKARLAAYQGNLEQWEEVRRLIADSSLGGPDAEAVAARITPALGTAIALGAQYLARAEDAEAERDLLLEALMATFAVLEQPTSAPNADYTIVPLLVAGKLAERDRLRAVVDALRTYRSLADEAVELQAAEHAVGDALAALDQLDVSPDIGGGDA